MRDWKGREHRWPRRLPSERRISPRVRVGFPVALTKAGGEPVPGAVTDVSIGGLRVQVPRFVEPLSIMQLRLELAVTNRDGQRETHRFDAPVKVVRTVPEMPLVAGDHAEEYELSIQFTADDPERERIIGVFMLQTLLFEQGSELT